MKKSASKSAAALTAFGQRSPYEKGAACFFMTATIMVLSGYVHHLSQTWKYRPAYMAIEGALSLDMAADVGDTGSFYDWMDTVLRDAISDYSGQIDTYCSHEVFEPVEDKLEACPVRGLLAGAGDKIYLTGGHNLMLFAVTASRSHPEEVYDRDIGKQPPNFNNFQRSTSDLNALEDPRFVEMCSWNNATNWCILKDGLKGTSGSTFGLSGSKNPDGNEYTYEGDIDFVDSPSEGYFPSVGACFANGDFTQPAYSGLTECDLIMVNPGAYVRNACVRMRQETIMHPMRLYQAGSGGFTSLPGLQNVAYKCTDVFEARNTEQELERVFLHTLNTDLIRGTKWHGTYISTSTLDAWAQEAPDVMADLRAGRFIDDYTRHVRVEVMTRDLGRNSLYYTFTRLHFRFLPDGDIKLERSISFVPIINYYYGTDGYPLKFSADISMEFVLLFFTTMMLGYVVLTVARLYNSDATHYRLIWEEWRGRAVHAFRGVWKFSGAVLPSGGQGDTQVDEAALNLTSDDVILRDTVLLLALDSLTVFVFFLALSYRVEYVLHAQELNEYILQNEIRDSWFVVVPLVDLFDTLVADSQRLTLALTWLIIVSLVQCLRFMSVFKGVAVVTETLRRSGTKMISLLGVFMIVLGVYAVLANMLYGAALDKFKSFPNSVSTLMLVLLENIDFQELREISPLSTDIFYWSFIFICFFLLLNMVLSIVLDTYSGVVERHYGEEAAEGDSAIPAAVSTEKNIEIEDGVVMPTKTGPPVDTLDEQAGVSIRVQQPQTPLMPAHRSVPGPNASGAGSGGPVRSSPGVRLQPLELAPSGAGRDGGTEKAPSVCRLRY